MLTIVFFVVVDFVNVVPVPADVLVVDEEDPRDDVADPVDESLGLRYVVVATVDFIDVRDPS